MFSAILLVLLVAVSSIILIRALRRGSTPTVQEATIARTNLLELLVTKNEKEFERKVQVLLEELDTDVIFVIDKRASQLEARNDYYTSLYSMQIKSLSKCLEGILSSTPNRVRKRKRFKVMEKRLRFYLNNNTPLRFFIILENDHDDPLFHEFYDFLIEKDLEEIYRNRIQHMACIYCQIKETIRTINQINNDMLSFNKFLADNATLIEAIRAM